MKTTATATRRAPPSWAPPPKALRESLRAEGVAARYGGEEFAVIARGSDASGAHVLAERLRARIAQTLVPVAGRNLRK